MDSTRIVKEHTLCCGNHNFIITFAANIIESLWNAFSILLGQPFLVNALAHEVTYEMRENRDRSVRILPEMTYQAQERIIYRRDTHIDILIDKLKERSACAVSSNRYWLKVRMLQISLYPQTISNMWKI